VDCYYPVSSEAFFIIVGVKNVIAFGFSYGAIPWIMAWGFKRAIGCVAGITFGIMLFGLPLYLWKEVEICGSQMETHHVVMGIKDSVLYISHILVPTTSNEQSSLTRISRLDGQKGVGR
jgi:hypothetical protein